MKNILITGANGQIGTELTLALRERYGTAQVVASDIKPRPAKGPLAGDGHYETIDCRDYDALMRIVSNYEIDTIYHLAAILSASAEGNPQKAWDINMNGLHNVLEVARLKKCAVFTPSSIGAFGPGTPVMHTPQDTLQRPNTIYGVTKVAGELLCDYYHKRFDVDTRGVRYPGIISYKQEPGGGTTDYAVEIFYKAVREKQFTSPLKKGTRLDMMYMPDAIKAAIDLMEAEPWKLIHRNAFNVTAMSIGPEDMAAEIRKHIPGFKLDYDIDQAKQNIADSWPDQLDDSAAREEWDWEPNFSLKDMTSDMLAHLYEKLATQPA